MLIKWACVRPSKVWVVEDGPVLALKSSFEPERLSGLVNETGSFPLERVPLPAPSSEPWICWVPEKHVRVLPRGTPEELTDLPNNAESIFKIWQSFGPLVNGIDFKKERWALREWAKRFTSPGVEAVPVSRARAALGCIQIAVTLLREYGEAAYNDVVEKVKWWDGFADFLQSQLGENKRQVGIWFNPIKNEREVGLIRNRPPEVGRYYLKLPPPQKGETLGWASSVLRANARKVPAYLSVGPSDIVAVTTTVFHAALLQLAAPKHERLCLCGCGRPIPPGRSRYATDACRKRMWRRKQKELD